MIFRKTFFLCVIGVLTLVSLQVQAEDKAAGFTEAQKTELEKIIKDYLYDNPQIIMESVQKYQEKQMQDVTAEAEKKIPEYKEFLMAKDNPSIGPAAAKITVIEFFDFNCGYCKQAFHDINKLSQEHKDVRFVFKEFPILSPTSKLASEWALAAHRQGKYFEYHKGLMEHKGGYDEVFLEKLGKDLGLDTEKLKKDAASPEIAAELAKNMQVGMELGIRGTPGFIVNGKSFPGYLGEEGLKEAIKEAGKS